MRDDSYASNETIYFHSDSFEGQQQQKKHQYNRNNNKKSNNNNSRQESIANLI